MVRNCSTHTKMFSKMAEPNVAMLVGIAIVLFILDRMWWRTNHNSPPPTPPVTHTVIHHRPAWENSWKPAHAHLNVQAVHDPYGRYPPPVVPTSAQINRPERVGYIVPVGGKDSDRHLGDYSQLPLFKNRFDNRGYRSEYFTEHNGARIYVMSKKDETKTCNRRSGTDGCAELYKGDDVKLAINDATYRVHLYPR